MRASLCVLKIHYGAAGGGIKTIPACFGAFAWSGAKGRGANHNVCGHLPKQGIEVRTCFVHFSYRPFGALEWA